MYIFYLDYAQFCTKRVSDILFIFIYWPLTRGTTFHSGRVNIVFNFLRNDLIIFNSSVVFMYLWIME